ncbi:MAG: N-acetyl-gamma-glutamyl-phosphate reductase [Anaerovoracaceae bacterium]|nr:N-acetyl-gamma-glutamyl-phosphate reductase [Bacillota bacterium]MDD7734939.1 N-acetyl-gamma-glutamyl-phosphate reductase [Bacillota bacterium]MDY5905907.1 N-acetyl-gamma-glutamyl-phosphate reductase [Anaerovoracaceae bacterium]
MIKAGIIGATGYAGQQLASLLVNHPEAEIKFVSSNSYAGQLFSDIYPQFYKILDMPLLSTEEAKAAMSDVDVVFTALPNGLVFELAQLALEKGIKIIDFSADFRLDDPDVYEEWYKTEHTAKDLISKQVYGLAELWRDKIKGADLIANPGCYTTASILAISALLREDGLVDTDHIIIDAKSGITGSGRKKDLSLLYAEAGESVKAYGIAHHRHTPEIEQELSKVAGKEIQVQFTPHLMPMKRGILATIYVDLKKDVTEDDLYAVYEKYYGDENFIRIRRGMCETRFVVGTNFCDISVRVDQRTHRAIITSCIDNMVKGAAGQAVQNMNVAFGLEETAGLKTMNIVAP